MTNTTPHNAPIESRERKRDRRRSFTVFFSIFSLLNAYTFLRIDQAIPESSWLSGVFPPLFIFVALSYIVGQFIEYRSSSFISDSLTWIGALWLGVIAWLLPAIILIDLVRFGDTYFHYWAIGNI